MREKKHGSSIWAKTIKYHGYLLVGYAPFKTTHVIHYLIINNLHWHLRVFIGKGSFFQIWCNVYSVCKFQDFSDIYFGSRCEVWLIVCNWYIVKLLALTFFVKIEKKNVEKQV